MDSPINALSRRDFLKLGGYAALGLLLPDFSLPFTSPDNTDLEGRVTERNVWIFDAPSEKSNKIELVWRDAVLPITGVEISDEQEAHNRVWYRIGEKGFMYSGDIQPVRTLLNQPAKEFPRDGLLGEISVPFTDAHESADPESRVAHRMYYETVHWVSQALTGEDGETWYRLLDDKWNQYYFIQARHLRLIPEDEIAPLSPDIPSSQKRIEVHLSRQLVLAFELERLVFAARVSTGYKFFPGMWGTPIGRFKTYYKRPTRHMANGDIAANGFDFPGVPWVLYITEKGISFHGTYWHNDYGRPRSHGCINMTPHSAKWLYRWTVPVVEPGKHMTYKDFGTLVDIIE